MLKKSPEGIYQSTLLLSIAGLTHGYSSRRFGDMRLESQRKKFLGRLNIAKGLTSAQQVHGNKISIVDVGNFGKLIMSVDGLASKIWEGGLNPVLSLHVADCVPILAVDPKSGVFGVAHAGWRGALGNIAGCLIQTMEKIGATAVGIYVSIGPHIGSCCYNVDETRAKKFGRALGSLVVCHRGKDWYLDLGAANRQQLIDAGVLGGHIEDESLCTSCNDNEFYSYRKDFPNTFGEMLGVITYGS